MELINFYFNTPVNLTVIHGIDNEPLRFFLRFIISLRFIILT